MIFRNTVFSWPGKDFGLVLLFFLSAMKESWSQSPADTLVTEYFQSGAFKPGIAEQNKLILFLRRSNRTVILKEIAAYTDSVGSDQDNDRLGQQRGAFVRQQLRKYVILSDRFNIKNYGESRPQSQTDNALNRRVTIRVGFEKKAEDQPDSADPKTVKVFVLKNLYFRPDEPVVEPASMPYLDYVAGILRSDRSHIFEIRGNVNWNATDISAADSGYRRKMDQLSADRAKVIYDILVDKGITARRMSWKGMGNREMLFPDAVTEEEKRKNMRVEILFLPAPEPAPNGK